MLVQVRSQLQVWGRTRVLPGERVILAQNFLKIVDVCSVEGKEYRAVDCGFLSFFPILFSRLTYLVCSRYPLEYLESAPFLSSSSQKGRICLSHPSQNPPSPSVPSPFLSGRRILEAIPLRCT